MNKNANISDLIEESLCTFNQLFEGGPQRDILLPKFASMLEKKQEITRESYFQQVQEMTCEDLQCDKVVKLFEDIWAIESIRNQRKKFILSHWLYFHIQWVRRTQETGADLIPFISDVLDKKEEADKTIEEIAQKVNFNHQQTEKLKSNAKMSPLYEYLVKRLAGSGEMNEEKIKEKHTELIQIMKKMFKIPGVIEFELQKHILVAFEKVYKIHSKVGEKVANQLIQIKQLVDLVNKNQRLTNKIKGKFEDYLTASDKQRYNILEGIKSELNVIDVYLLDYLIRLSKQNVCQENGQNSRKNIVLFVGPSGSGKTTIILRLLGYKLVPAQIQELETLQPLGLRPQHAALRTSPESTSTTRYMFATKIPKDSFSLGTDQELFACDSPGFEDSAGSEVDIANSIGIQAFLRKCASVKLVIVISQRRIGDKYEGIREIARIVSNIVVSYKQIEKGVSIVVNKFDCEKEYARIKPGLENVLKNLTPAEQANKEYVEFLSSLFKRFGKKKGDDVIRFHPEDTDIPELMDEFKQGKITNPSDVFKYSLSTKSAQAKANKKILLQKLIKENLGKNNDAALYYIKELTLFGQCLDDTQIEQEVKQIKNDIRRKVEQKFKTFEKRIDGELLQNDANSNTFKELDKIKEEVGNFEVFKGLVDNMLTTAHIEEKIVDVKKKMIESIETLSFEQNLFEESKHKVISTIKFFSKFDATMQGDVFQRLILAYETKKQDLEEIITKGEYLAIRKATLLLKNMTEIIQKAEQTMKIDENNPEKIIIDHKKQLNDIKDRIKLTFQTIADESTKNFKSFNQESFVDIKGEDIATVSQTITMLETLEAEGPILNDIYARPYKNAIVETIANYGRMLIEESNKILDPRNTQNFNSHEIENIKHYKSNTLKLKDIKGVYSIIGDSIDRLWNSFERFISGETQRLNTFLDELKNKKEINKKTLKNFKLMIDRIVKFSEGDENLVDSINKLKVQIKRSLAQHIKALKNKVDIVKITIKLRKTLNLDDLAKLIERFKEVEAFYMVKEFKDPTLFSVVKVNNDAAKNDAANNDADKSKIINGENEEEDDDPVDISAMVEKMYDDIIKKFLNPYKQITEQSNKFKNKGISKITMGYFQTLDDFIQYKNNLFDKDITVNKQFAKKVTEIEEKADNFKSNIKAMIDNLSKEFSSIYQGIVDSDEPKHIYRFEIRKIKEFKRFINIILLVKNNSNLEELFLQEDFLCPETIEKIGDLLKRSQEAIKAEIFNRKKTNIDHVSNLLFLRDQTEEMKSFDDLDFEDTKSGSGFQFDKLYQQITKDIGLLEGKQANAITNLFKDDAIILSDVEKMYTYFSKDEFKNDENLLILCNKLKQHGDKLKKSINSAKEEFRSEDAQSLDNQNASNYIIKLEKGFKFFQHLNRFIAPKFLQVFTLNQTYFTNEISEIQLEENIKKTYECVKTKLSNFEYKTKQRDFERIISIIKKAEYIIEKMTKDEIYSKLYNQVEQQESSEIPEGEPNKPKKFSQRLTYFMVQTQNKFQNTFVDSAPNEDFLFQNNFIKMYSNVSEEEKSQIDLKIDNVMHQKIKIFEGTYEQSEEQKKNMEEKIRLTVDKLPQAKRTMYRDVLENIKTKMRIKEEDDMRNIQKQFKQPTSDVFGSIIKFEQIKNPKVQEKCKNLIEQQLKSLGRDICIQGQKGRMKAVQSFKRYQKYFGSENIAKVQKVMGNKKLRDLFLMEERNFYGSLTYEVKEVIRQIESEFVRGSAQGFTIYEIKCNEMNEIYQLILEDGYEEATCSDQRKQILKFWEDYINKMNNKLQEFALAPEIILSQAERQYAHIERFVIELKFARIFINSLIQHSKLIMNQPQPRFQEIKNWAKKFQATNIDKIIISKLTTDFNTMVKEIEEKNFYDDDIKILNFAALENEFEKKIINPFKIIREFEGFYGKHLVQREEDMISSSKLIVDIQEKWQDSISLAKEELSSAIIRPEEEVTQRILILYNLCQIITTKKWDIIDKSLKSKQAFEEFMDSQFEKVNSSFNSHLSKVDEIIQEKQLILNRYSESKQKAESQYQQIRALAEEKNAQLQIKIDASPDDEVKSKLSVEFQNIENFKNESIEKIKNQLYQNFIKEKEANDETLRVYIKGNVLKEMIVMKKVMHSVQWRTKDNNERLIGFMDNLNKKSKNINQIIYSALNSSSNNYALIIAAESDIFKSQAALEFKNKTAKQDINYIIEKCPQLKNDKNQREEVLSFYDQYEKEYNRIIDNFKLNPDEEQINIVAKQLRDQKAKNQGSRRINDGISTAITIARIFATWSMMKVDLSNKEDISVDFQPHPAQIVAIYLLIGFNDASLTNVLIEVLTGEGKSIVLAGLCCYLALKGFFPYCACYSEYLSSRDEKDFKELFERLDVSKKIKYGTFNQHCEEIINESSGKGMTFRDHMKTVIKGQASRATLEYFARIFDSQLHKRSKKILIIDEADVFFNENFFGQLYCPSLTLDDEEIKNLIEFVWKITKESRENDSLQKVQKEDVYESSQFDKVNAKYPGISELLKNQVIGMIQGAYNYKHGYVIHMESIKYRDNDSITDKISYGYKTVFANCYEYERKAISQLSYNSALKITLNIAPFSYSELPTFFQNILGVSGTVNSMSDYKKEMLKSRYHIEDTYEIPSIYGDNQRTKDDFTIVKNDAYYDQIVAHTKKQAESKRPIALFFKSIRDVTNFYKSPQFKEFTKNTTILSEETDHDSRETIIKRVGQREKITIMTESFSRGTDFKIFDKSINDIGGLHVIQTFISADLSEYIQIRGRTGRQGSKGSVEVLVNENELEKFEIANKVAEFEESMKDAWKKKDLTELQQLKQRVDSAQAKHELTEQIFRKKPSREEIINFIFSHNKFNEIRSNHVRTLIGIDGTSSMGPALEKVKTILEDSFTRTKQVLDKKKVQGSFENQIAIYRNYNSEPDELFEYSGFETDSEKLKEFLSKIRINGGWVNEAMEVLFQHANKLSKLDQIIIIADARANPFPETKYKRSRKTEQFWNQNGFPIANETEEVIKLKNRRIKVHTLYIYLESSSQEKKEQLREYCELISNQTQGISSQLPLKDKNASQFLTAFLVKNILLQIGGEENGRELVESYDKDFGSVPMRL